MAVAAQRSPQLTPSQVVVRFMPIGPVGQAAHRVPHVAGSRFDTHWPLQSWKLVLQVMLQLVPSQLARPFAGCGHGVQLVPHELID